uniref:Uncharacterized protein n=1 Tax=Rhizophora mucronata TaxID=61149 RepID=A0A2P2NN50_RHIMU
MCLEIVALFFSYVVMLSVTVTIRRQVLLILIILYELVNWKIWSNFNG